VQDIFYTSAFDDLITYV